MGNEGTDGVRPIQAQQMRERAVAAHVNVPIEQTWVWYEFEETFPGRTLIGFFEIVVEGEPVALVALQRVEYHGFHFLWAKHGPVWLVPVDVELEKRVVETLVAWAKKNARMTPFIRLHLSEPVCGAQPPVQMITYDRTVVLDVTGTPEDVLSRFSAKGRTNVRRSIRRNPVSVTDETEQASADFGPYYRMLAETADRQGFNAWDADVYQNMVRELGPEHVRVFAARDEGGQLCGVSIVTVSGTDSAYYYAATNDLGRSLRAPEQLVFGAASIVGKDGVETLDLMGIGSELSPSLDSLTSFKMKFVKEATEVAPAWDVPVNKAAYRALIGAREGARALRRLTAKLSERARELAHRK